MQRIIQAFRKLRRAKESGISLVELLVAMVLLGVASTIVIGLFLSATQTVSMASAIHNDTGTASNVMNAVSKAIRSGTTVRVSGAPNAPALITATPTELVMYSLADSDAVDPRPVRIEFTRDPTSLQLVEKRWAPAAAANGFWDFTAPTLISSRTFPGALTNGNVFTYNTAAGDAVPAPTAAQLGLIASVTVEVTVHGDARASGTPVILKNTVGMPNLGFSETETP
ncbi:pilus assembly FimT family protein [Mycetocola zhadangensis]|uniref:Type II secretion system protein n=1 Tax=Mycetocola zhadangensis TaxID=1164595 RepID=A0A3L7J4A9_9MICO|nr:type II secretion system protein [Mycetocola zhadangensis]RLQ85354.1 type II secretion system protein [Mycetocola zhadangensis]GGE81889.1 hypothetical protein GCM10011313_00390 [Mycetocola zhadangensis]